MNDKEKLKDINMRINIIIMVLVKFIKLYLSNKTRFEKLQQLELYQVELLHQVRDEEEMNG